MQGTVDSAYVSSLLPMFCDPMPQTKSRDLPNFSGPCPAESSLAAGLPLFYACAVRLFARGGHATHTGNRGRPLMGSPRSVRTMGR